MGYLSESPGLSSEGMIGRLFSTQTLSTLNLTCPTVAHSYWKKYLNTHHSFVLAPFSEEWLATLLEEKYDCAGSPCSK